MLNLLMKILEKMYLSMEGNRVYTDSLTNVKSREYYDEVAKIKYHNFEIVVVFIDINNLKAINDHYGHSIGSKHIAEVAGHLKSIFPGCDVCRIGGDEFIIFAKPSMFDNSSLIEELVSDERFSVGYYEKEVYEDVSSAVRKADESMYKDKERKHGLSGEDRRY